MEVRTHMYVHKYFKHFNSYIATGQFCKWISNVKFYLNIRRLSQWEYSMKLLYQPSKELTPSLKQVSPERGALWYRSFEWRFLKGKVHLIRVAPAESLKGSIPSIWKIISPPCPTFLWMKDKLCFLSNPSTLQKLFYL